MDIPLGREYSWKIQTPEQILNLLAIVNIVNNLREKTYTHFSSSSAFNLDIYAFLFQEILNIYI